MLRSKSILFILIILVFTGITGYSQILNDPFESLKKKREFIYGLDNRRTHIKEHHSVIYGVYMGVGYGKKLRYKISISGTPFEVGKFVDENGILKRNRLLFFSLGEEFDFYEYKRFGMTTYLQTGIGRNFYRKFNENGMELETGSELIIPIEAGLNFNYALKPYLKIKSGFGWRFVLPKYSSGLSGYYLKLGLGFNVKKFLEHEDNKWIQFSE